MKYLGPTTDPKHLARQDDPLGPESTITSAVTGGASTTADFEFASLTVPAGFITTAGMSFFAEVLGRFTKPAGTMNLNLWLKVNGTKVATIVLAQTNPAQTNAAVHFNGRLTVRSLGVSGVVATSTAVSKFFSTGGQNDGNFGTVTVDTSLAVTISIGANMSTSAAGQTMTAEFARVGML